MASGREKGQNFSERETSEGASRPGAEYRIYGTRDVLGGGAETKNDPPRRRRASALEARRASLAREIDASVAKRAPMRNIKDEEEP